jgi:alkylation response protein AidB-like acyl-CoA dehydrogenase
MTVSGATVGLRDELFARVDAIGPVLAADVAVGEKLRRLPDTTVSALREAGLLRLKVPAVVGGTEAEPGLQFEVFERVAMTNASAAWCLFIYADGAGGACANLPDAGLEQFLAGGDVPIVCGGGGLIPGILRPERGGYRLSGHFRYGSGIDAAAWVMVLGLLDGGNGGPPAIRVCVVPRDAFEVEDTWHVLGMRATGSNDFNIDDVFVPEEMTFAPGSPCRGGRMYRTGFVGYLGYTIPAVILGIVRRALDELTAMASGVTRGYSQPQTLASRVPFQNFLGAADQRLKAAHALMVSDGSNLMQSVDSDGVDLPAVEAGTRAAGALAVRTASDVLADIMRFAGGSALREGSLFEQATRDVTVAASHFFVSESAYENHAKFLLGLAGGDPMA